MPKRPDTKETVLLAVDLLCRMPRNIKVSASERHAQLAEFDVECNIQTIHRQMVMLSKHFDIERDGRNKPYGYK